MKVKKNTEYKPKQKVEAASSSVTKSKNTDTKTETKIYTDKAEYENALQAYNDSISMVTNAQKYELGSENLGRKIPIKPMGYIPYDKATGADFFEKKDDAFPTKEEAYGDDKIKPIAFKKADIGSGTIQYEPIYQMPVTKPEYKEPTIVVGKMETETKPVTSISGPSGTMTKKQFIDKYGEENGLKIWKANTGQK